MVFLGLLPLMFAVVTSAAHKLQCPHGVCSESRRNNQCPPTVLNHLDPGNSGVERLVIFLYKKVDTGELISFIPEKRYQHEIPDSPEEHGTIYEMPEEMTIKEIYENSPNREIREIDDKCKQIDQTESEDHNEESNEVVIVVDTQPTEDQLYNKDSAPDRSRMEQNRNKESESWHLPLNSDSEQNKHNPSRPENPAQTNPLNDNIPEANENYAPEALSDHFEDYEHDTQHSTGNELPDYIIPQNTNDHQQSHEQNSEKPTVGDEYPLESNPPTYTQETQNNGNDNQNYHEKESDKHIHENAYPPRLDQPEGHYDDHHSTGDESNRDVEENPPESHKQNVQEFPYIQKPIENPRDTADHQDTMNSGGFESSRPNNIPHRHNVRVPVYNHGKFIGWSTHTVTHKKTYWQSPFIDPSYYARGPNELPYNRIEHDNIATFDYWLHRQLDIITFNGNKILASPDDINALQIEIRNILLQNGYMVTKQGLLIDGHGAVTSLESLRIQPILIGKSLSNRRFSKHLRSDVQLTIPSNTPFLEGLLVTMVNPPKVLGIVPLSITSLPQKIGSGHNKDEITIKGHVEPVDKSLLTVLPISELVSFRKWTGKRRPRFRSGWNKNDNKYLGKALADVMKKAKKKEHAGGGYTKKPKDKGISEEVPDFRIIGGISATVSGTPIVNKGRSGHVHRVAYYT